MYPVKDSLSNDVRSESFDDEAFETGNKDQFDDHAIFKSASHALICGIFDRFIHCAIAVLDTGV